jgi:hypothetical protein
VAIPTTACPQTRPSGKERLRLTAQRGLRRRDALVGVHDKSSQFAGRAVHEWTGQLFATSDGSVLSAQYKLMIRTERKKAREKGKHKAIEPYAYCCPA